MKSVRSPEKRSRAPWIAGAVGLAGFVGVTSLFAHQTHRLDTQAPIERAAGNVFGARTDQGGCVDEALRRGVACADDNICELGAADFLSGCLPAARPTPGFCEGVPDFSFKNIGNETWSRRFWIAHGRPHHGGIVTDEAIRNFCHPR